MDIRFLARRIGPAIAVAVFLAAAWLLYRELGEYGLQDVRAAVAEIPLWRLWVAAALTALNYLILIGYDYLALEASGHRLPGGQVALASFMGFVTSFNFGFLLGGTSIRYRLYSSWGLSALEIMKLMMILGISFWMSLFALAGVVFSVAPPALLPDGFFPFGHMRLFGILFLAILAAYVGLGRTRRRIPGLGGVELPETTVAVKQMVVGVADLLVSAAALYVLVGGATPIGYIQFLPAYLLAILGAMATQVPGGVGILELIVLKVGFPETSPEVVAGLLAFRVIYYLFPLLVATTLLFGIELARHATLARRVWFALGQWADAIAPTLLAMSTFLSGAVLLLSGTIPILPGRAEILERALPLGIVEVSHFIGSLAGAGLLVLARGLQRRLDSAWWLALGLLGTGIAASLLKGFNYEEGLLLAVVMAALGAGHHSFYRKGSLIGERFTPAWTAAVFIVIVSSISLGVFAHQHVEYSSELWWVFAFSGDAPRAIRAGVGAMAVLLLFALSRLIAPSRPVGTSGASEGVEAAAAIVARSTRTFAHLALLGDKSFLFSPERRAFVMYALQRRSWIAMGDPVGRPEAFPELVWAFRELADSHGGWPVFYQVEPNTLPVYVDQGMELLKLGEEASVPLDSFGLEGGHRKGLRQAHRHGERADLKFSVVGPEEVSRRIQTLEEVSRAWLAHKGMTEKGFSLGYFDRDYLRRGPCALVERSGETMAFANLWCGADKKELAVDLMRYRPDSPQETMEFLFVELMLWGRREGYASFSLGMAPLSGLDTRHLAPLWNRIADLVFQHGEHFYSFEGLRQYKEKFDPVWTPRYLASPGGIALPRILTDLTMLIRRRRAWRTSESAGQSSEAGGRI